MVKGKKVTGAHHPAALTPPEPGTYLGRLLSPFTELFGLSRVMAIISVFLLAVITVFAIFWFFHLAPPDTITITSGPPNSVLETNAMRYAKILERKGIHLKILPSQGSLENLQRLANPGVQVDIGFVQGGVTNVENTGKLVSLGSISYAPLLIFCRNETPVAFLSDLAGKRIAIGPVGSGTRSLALTLLHLNGIDPGGATTLDGSESVAAAQALLAGKMDAIFMMGDSAAPQLIKQLLLASGVQLLNFTQADGYTRQVSYLNKLLLPQGSIDFGRNIPPHDINLIGPTVELIARPKLHPALSDLIIEAAQEVHGKPGLFRRNLEFPAPLEHDFPISSDATRYYTSGKKYLYQALPFWLASVVYRVLIAFVPVVVILIPGLRILPSLFRLRIKLLIFRWYRALLALEAEVDEKLTPKKREKLAVELDHIEAQVNHLKVPASFADQFYGLRGHIVFVRERLMANAPEANAA